MDLGTRRASRLRRAALPAAVVTLLAAACASPAAAAPEPFSTSPSAAARGAKAAPAAAAANAITFSEFALGTNVVDQYAAQGIRFFPGPFITTDGSNPTSPVLSGTPKFFGTIHAKFTVPGGTADATVDGFTVDVGYVDRRDSTVIDYYDASGQTVGRVYAQDYGINHLTVTYRGVAGFFVRSISTEPNGFAIDNLEIARDAQGAPVARMVSLGDSYTSGEGLLPGSLRYDCATDLASGSYWRDTTLPSYLRGWIAGQDCDTRTGSTDRPADLFSRGFAKHANTCHRHHDAYPNLIRERLGISGPNFLFVACSGAVTENVGLVDKPKAQQPDSPVNVAGGNTQIVDARAFASSGQPQLITIGIGGNDAGFTGIAAHCYLLDCANEGYGEGVVNKIGDTVFDKLYETFSDLRDAFPAATIVAFGYPSVIGDTGKGCAGLGSDFSGIEPNERLWIRDTLLPALNAAVSDAAREAGLSYVDISPVTKGHEICSDHGEWVNGLRAGNGFGPIAKESLHLNQYGHRQVAAFFAEHYLDSSGRLLLANPEPAPTIRPDGGPEITVGRVDAGSVTPCGAGCLQPAACVQACVIHVEGAGFAPRSVLELTLHSDPVSLGSVTADDDGAFVADVQLPAGIAPGTHALAIAGRSPDGELQDAVTAILVYETQPPPLRSDPPAAPEPVPVAAPKPAPVRASAKVLGWRGRTLFVKLGCPKAATSSCRIVLGVRAPAVYRKVHGKRVRAHRARTLASRSFSVRAGKSKTVSLRRRATTVSRRKLQLTLSTRTSAGTAAATLSLRSAKTLHRRPKTAA